jgi:hypothetical protein
MRRPTPFPICGPSQQAYFDDVMTTVLRDEAAADETTLLGEHSMRDEGNSTKTRGRSRARARRKRQAARQAASITEPAAPTGSRRRSAARDLEALGPEERDALARELGVSAGALVEIAAFGDEVARLMLALALDPEQLREQLPRLMCELRLICAGCDSKSRCRSDLARGRAASRSFTAYCPSARTLAVLHLAAMG